MKGKFRRGRDVRHPLEVKEIKIRGIRGQQFVLSNGKSEYVVIGKRGELGCHLTNRGFRVL